MDRTLMGVPVAPSCGSTPVTATFTMDADGQLKLRPGVVL